MATSGNRTEIDKESKLLQVIQSVGVLEQDEDLDDFYASLSLSLSKELEPPQIE